MNRLFFARLYEANLPNGRKQFCPRVGIYKPLAVSMGLCYGRPALMMKAHWRPSLEDTYMTNFVVDVQLTSVVRNANRVQRNNLNERGLIGKEIVVYKANYNQNSRNFSIRFELRPIALNLKEINLMLKHGNNAMFELAMQKYWRKYWF